MLVTRQDVVRLIPQRQPIVVVHALLEHNDQYSVTEFLVEEEHLFVRDGKLLPSGIMENIAQSSALRSGYQFLNDRQAATGEAIAPPVGFIGGVKNFHIEQLPNVGETLNTRISIMHEVMGMQVVEATVLCSDRTTATCEMKIFLTKEDSSDTSN